MRPILIGIAGGSGSGKSSVTREIIQAVGSESVAVIKQDNYYKDQSHLPPEERVKTNYDHPDAFDNDLLISHLEMLAQGQSIEMPIYDFTVHNRSRETETILPKKIIILEGILIFVDPNIRSLLDMKVYVDTDSDVRIIRRIQRDMKERGRSLDSIIDQYMSTVRKAHLQFVENSKRYADIIIPEGGQNYVAIDLLVRGINAHIREGN